MATEMSGLGARRSPVSPHAEKHEPFSFEPDFLEFSGRLIAAIIQWDVNGLYTIARFWHWSVKGKR